LENLKELAVFMKEPAKNQLSRVSSLTWHFDFFRITSQGFNIHNPLLLFLWQRENLPTLQCTSEASSPAALHNEALQKWRATLVTKFSS
jgi:hypothetical protein